MRKTLCLTVLLVLACFLLMPSAAMAQAEKTSSPQKSASEKPGTSKAPNQLRLQSITLVNTAEVARKVAEEASTRARSAKSRSGGSSPAGTQQGRAGAVLEFHVTDSSPLVDRDQDSTAKAKSSKKSVLKNIHGSAYGTTASSAGGANGEGGAIGADSGNGKFSIFWEGEHAHANTPTSH